MISVNSNNNVNSYWQTMASSIKPKVPAYGTYPPTQTSSQTSKPPIDMQSMFKLMFQVLKRYQSLQGQRYGKTQSVFSDSANPYSKKNPADYGKRFLSPSPVAKVPTPATENVESTAFLFAMLLSKKQALEPKQTLPTKPVPPKAITKPPVEETLDLPIYTPPPPPPDVVLIGSYNSNINPAAGVTINLGQNIKDFASMEGGNPDNWSHTVHNRDKNNDQLLKEIYAKLSDEDKNKTFTNGEVYAISKSTGKIIGTVANTQIVNAAALVYESWTANFKNDQFKIIDDLGIDKTTNWGAAINMEEGNGGTIELDGKVYNVETTVLRKNTPLTFDLNGDGVKTSNKVIQYDIDGNGTLDTINDVADGTLTIRGGASGLDVFGNNTDLDGDGKADGFKNGFDALKALALKEGLIDGQKDMVLDANDLALLQKKYQLAMKTAGYNSKNENLADLGISQINLGKSNDVKNAENFDAQGNDLLTQEGSTFKINGQTRDYADVLHQLK
jgi:hypothetical protein